jgi:hypothetical protein
MNARHLPGWEGVWRVDEFALDEGVATPAKEAAPVKRWTQIGFAGWGLAIRTADDALLRYGAEDKADEKVLQLKGKDAIPLKYERSDGDHVELRGSWQTHALRVKLARVPASEQVLPTRGFHWVSEYPFNR